MPWSTEEAREKNHHITSDEQARQWVHVANGVLERTGDEARAIREANSVIMHRQHRGGIRSFGG